MSEATVEAKDDWMGRLALALAFILVVTGMANNLPNIPGLLETVRSIPGLEGLPRLSKYSSEFFFPLMFSLMLVIALLVSSFGRNWRDGPKPRFGLGILLDVLMLAAILGTSLVYLIEHDQVCLIDTVSGERTGCSPRPRPGRTNPSPSTGRAGREFPECQAIQQTGSFPGCVRGDGLFVYVVTRSGIPHRRGGDRHLALHRALSPPRGYFDWADHAI